MFQHYYLTVSFSKIPKYVTEKKLNFDDIVSAKTAVK